MKKTKQSTLLIVVLLLLGAFVGLVNTLGLVGTVVLSMGLSFFVALAAFGLGNKRFFLELGSLGTGLGLVLLFLNGATMVQVLGVIGCILVVAAFFEWGSSKTLAFLLVVAGVALFLFGQYLRVNYLGS